MTDYAKKFIDLNRTYATQKNSCGPCQEPYHQGTMLGEQTMKKCDKHLCTSDVINKEGLGQGRHYSNNHGKCDEWPKNLPNKQPYSCCAETNDLFNYYNHVDTKAQGELVPRNSIPSGGKWTDGGDPAPFNL